MNVFHHGGATGDLIYSLQTVKRLGGGVMYVQLPMPLYDAVKPLLESQQYIEEVVDYEKYPITHELDEFRTMPDVENSHLVLSHLRGQNADEEKWHERWIHLPMHMKEDYALINFTGRYHNPNFDWTKEYQYLKETYGKVYFVGLPNEYNDFKKSAPDIEYRQTNNFLDLAILIQRSNMFSGNQSAPMAIAQGLNHPHRIEVCPWASNCNIDQPFQTQLR